MEINLKKMEKNWNEWGKNYEGKIVNKNKI